MLLKDEAALGGDDRNLLDVLMEKCPPIRQMRHLAMKFRMLFAQGNTDQLDRWLQQAAGCGLPHLQIVAISLTRERKALLAAMTLL
ncbi:hypothetical protein GCM10008955_38160 [Deinococcus malanensis]|uniref:Uncharacterized protein n=1 Tax=Deinococcus malanensis TaxID=1706855 RepID=A0ABQ2F1L1_9DEIO|nr:hypothetical protein GCM10008955_38160 [Deinococcus malanensis]